MSLLVTGSLAYDRIAVFQDRFKNHILPGLAHRLNVAFTVKKMTVNFGGTAGNIAYNLALLGEKPVILGAAGNDFGEYARRLKKLGLDAGHIKIIAKELTAHATIMTDLDDNQITAFYMGAMNRAHEAKASSVRGPVQLAIVAPNGIRAMGEYATAFRKKGIPYIADPGQAIPALGKKELISLITGAHTLVVNDYEWQLIAEKTGWTKETVLKYAGHLIVTHGAEGAVLSERGKKDVRVPAFKASRVTDPTGCGDALRAGLMYGIKTLRPMKQALEIGCWLAARCVEVSGTQNHRLPVAVWRRFLRTLS